MDVEKLKRRKKELGYTFEMLSKLSGVPLGTIQKIFNGTTKSPRYSTLLALESVLEADRVRESEFAYTIDNHEKKQGEYTVEDYMKIPDERRVELIDGVIYDMASPSVPHQLIAGELYFQMKSFIREKKKDCVPFIAPFDVQLDCDNKTMVEPDVLVVCHTERLNRKRLFGAPDFAAEVLSPSTRKRDMSLKRNKYEAAGVREYWLVDPEKDRVISYVFGEEPDVNIYGFDQKIPVAMTAGECVIDFAQIKEEMTGYGL